MICPNCGNMVEDESYELALEPCQVCIEDENSFKLILQGKNAKKIR